MKGRKHLLIPRVIFVLNRTVFDIGPLYLCETELFVIYPWGNILSINKTPYEV